MLKRVYDIIKRGEFDLAILEINSLVENNS